MSASCSGEFCTESLVLCMSSAFLFQLNTVRVLDQPFQRPHCSSVAAAAAPAVAAHGNLVCLAFHLCIANLQFDQPPKITLRVHQCCSKCVTRLPVRTWKGVDDVPKCCRVLSVVRRIWKLKFHFVLQVIDLADSARKTRFAGF